MSVQCRQVPPYTIQIHHIRHIHGFYILVGKLHICILIIIWSNSSIFRQWKFNILSIWITGATGGATHQQQSNALEPLQLPWRNFLILRCIFWGPVVQKHSILHLLHWLYQLDLPLAFGGRRLTFSHLQFLLHSCLQNVSLHKTWLPSSPLCTAWSLRLPLTPDSCGWVADTPFTAYCHISWWRYLDLVTVGVELLPWAPSVVMQNSGGFDRVNC